MNKNDIVYAESIILANSYVKCKFLFDYSTKSTDLSFPWNLSVILPPIVNAVVYHVVQALQNLGVVET